MLDGCVSSVMMLRLGNNLIQRDKDGQRVFRHQDTQRWWWINFWGFHQQNTTASKLSGKTCRLTLQTSEGIPTAMLPAWSLPEHRLDVDDGLGVRHVVLLGAHRALFVHHHQVVSVDDSTLEQVVQAGPGHDVLGHKRGQSGAESSQLTIPFEKFHFPWTGLTGLRSERTEERPEKKGLLIKPANNN